MSPKKSAKTEPVPTTTRIPKIPGLKLEAGVTDISLSNARILTKECGKPSLVVLTKNGMEWVVTSYWGTKKLKFEFNGFAWGYGGEGPNGLATYLKELGLNVDITAIARIQDKDLPKVFEI